MFNMTKSELIKKYESGQLKDLGYHVLSNTHGAVIVHIDHDSDRVFGYLGDRDNKDYFFVKYSPSGNFRVGQLNLNTGQFIRY